MLRFLIRRLGGAVVVLLAVSFLTFVLLDVAPGDAAQTLVGESASDAQLAAVRAELGLDDSLIVRYARFVANLVLHGDLGESIISGQAVAGLVVSRFGYTIKLALLAMAVATVFGVGAGTLAATRPGGLGDLMVMGASSLGLALPTFWIALLLILFFSLRLHWVPVVGNGDWRHMLLPVVTLALPTAAVVARMVRSSLLDVKGADYVRTAHAKGLGRNHIWRLHIMRNGLIPVVTLLGLHLGHLLGGTFIVETIFAWPGLGRLVVQSVFDRDFPLLVGAVLLIALIYQVLNLMADLAHAWLDPRVGREAL